MSKELILNEIEKNQEEYIEFLRELIKTESYNPPGNEKNVAIKIEQYLKELNIKCEIFPFGDNRANLIAFLNDDLKNKNLLYNGHMDVVPPGTETEWKYPPLSATIKRNKVIYGRGTADMKGGLAAMTIAFKILKKLNLNLKGNLILNAVANEETGGEFGAKWCLKNILNTFKTDFTIIGETTHYDSFPMSIGLGEKGHVQLKIITMGLTSHSSVPFMGNNAISMLINILKNLDNFKEKIPKSKSSLNYGQLKNLMSKAFPNKEQFERVFKEQKLIQTFIKTLSELTMSITMIKGGVKENVIPDYCEAVLDIRTLPGQTTETIISTLKEIISSLNYSLVEEENNVHINNSVKIEIIENTEASFFNDWRESKDLELLYQIISDIYKRNPFYFMSPAGTDSKYFRNSGYCPKTIIVGPGCAESSHKNNEFIEIQDYINMIKVYALFAYEFLK